MKYFQKITSFENLKAQYKQLAFQHHPDLGGNVEDMKSVNAEYDSLYSVWYGKKASDEDYESAPTSRRRFYSQNGWEGQNYDPNLTMKEITSIIRAYVKKHYGHCKFSVTRQHYNSILVSLMTAPCQAFKEVEEVQDEICMESMKWGSCHFEEIKKRGYHQLNPYGISENWMLTNYVRNMLADINGFANSYNFDDSDSMTDYSHRNFYFNMHIGKWDKPFEQKGDMKFAETSDLKAA